MLRQAPVATAGGGSLASQQQPARSEPVLAGVDGGVVELAKGGGRSAGAGTGTGGGCSDEARRKKLQVIFGRQDHSRADRGGVHVDLGDGAISRQHARVDLVWEMKDGGQRRAGGGGSEPEDQGEWKCFLTDLSSSNGTFLNAVFLPAGMTVPLEEGDVVAFGGRHPNNPHVYQLVATGGTFRGGIQACATSTGARTGTAHDQPEAAPATTPLPATATPSSPVAESPVVGPTISSRGGVLAGQGQSHIPKGQGKRLGSPAAGRWVRPRLPPKLSVIDGPAQSGHTTKLQKPCMPPATPPSGTAPPLHTGSPGDYSCLQEPPPSSDCALSDWMLTDDSQPAPKAAFGTQRWTPPCSTPSQLDAPMVAGQPPWEVCGHNAEGGLAEVVLTAQPGWRATPYHGPTCGEGLQRVCNGISKHYREPLAAAWCKVAGHALTEGSSWGLWAASPPSAQGGTGVECGDGQGIVLVGIHFSLDGGVQKGPPGWV